MNLFTIISTITLMQILALGMRARYAEASTIENALESTPRTRSLEESKSESTSSSTKSTTASTASSSSAKDQTNIDFEKNRTNCKPVPKSQCELCAGGARSGRDGCEETGKRQEFYCEHPLDAADDDEKNNGTSSEESQIKVYMSCHRTRLEEEYLVMRLQGFCALVAFLSLRSVRREKIVNESLFDNRKRISRQNQTSQNHQEMTPLTSTRRGSGNDIDEECGVGLSSIIQSVHSLRSNESSD